MEGVKERKHFIVLQVVLSLWGAFSLGLWTSPAILLFSSSYVAGGADFEDLPSPLYKARELKMGVPFS